MRAIVFTALTSLLSSGLAAQELPDETAIVNELNLARTRPAEYATFLAELLPHFEGNILRIPGEIGIITDEGPAAVHEAIRFLERIEPMTSLRPAQGLALAARDHVRDQGPAGRMGHRGSDGSTLATRIERYTEWLGSISENIDYGSHTARRVLISLIVDDGVASRGHRENIFNPDARFVGVACGPHGRYEVMCVMDFADALADPGR